jgi:succinyl-CoA synthetase beta subunit
LSHLFYFLIVPIRWECRTLWNELHFPEGFGSARFPEEELVRELDTETGASFKLTVLNPKGCIWTLVAGGGASVMYADAICALGFGGDLGNYGEYSGGPSTDLTMRYADALFQVMLKEKIDVPKVLLIGGAVANFTSVAGTFKGIIKALTNHVNDLLAQKVCWLFSSDTDHNGCN